ncbi:MAG TPA: SNF2-related protein, partial [Nitrosomonas sp.]|nr:SNF2-related protein [Nitrosomonas sp.]
MARLFTELLHPEDIASVIDFNAADEAIADRYKSLRVIQTTGVAALYNVLCKRNYAYLADEVGMGKTFQALGLASIVWHMKPDARIVVICPRKNLQTKWIRDFGNFIANNYGKHWPEGDDIVKSALLGSSVITPIHCENLWEFADSVFAPGRVLPILRHTSFRRVAFLSKQRSVRENWEYFYERMMRSGLHYDAFPGRLPSEANAGEEFNERFGDSFNNLLRTVWNDEKPIDLLIFDEAQYLRNPANNSNTLFRAIFNNRVKKWLMLSATPLHSGAGSIINQIDSYACEDDPLFEESDVEDYPKLQSKLKHFLIRRPRMYVVSHSGKEMTKTMYRRHNAASDGIESKEVITSLSMALVQKKLVPVLDGNNNRYKIGFLSSFESLQDSISKSSREKRNGRKMDFEQFDTGQDIELEGIQEDDESLEGTEAPDERFISNLSRDFEDKFERPLPHPKLEHVVDSLWEDAFIRNKKVLLFVRRISTVKELEKLFEQKFTALVERRVRDVWGMEIEWFMTGETVPSEMEDDEELAERNERSADIE